MVLRFVAGEVGAGRLLFLASYRDVELTRDHPLAAGLTEIARGPGTTRLYLRGLNQNDVSMFIETITGRAPAEEIVHTIHGDTLGNPLFVGEMVRLLASEGGIHEGAGGRPWPIPEGVREVIGRRLDRLPEDCKQILVLASVMGRDFTVEGLERITGRSAGDLLGSVQDAVVAGVIGEVRQAPGTFRFTHSLMRDALYEDLLPVDRVRLHRAVGEALEAMYARDTQAVGHGNGSGADGPRNGEAQGCDRGRRAACRSFGRRRAWSHGDGRRGAPARVEPAVVSVEDGRQIEGGSGAELRIAFPRCHAGHRGGPGTELRGSVTLGLD